MIFNKTQWQRDSIERKRERGECTRCKNQATPGGRYCEKCREYERNRKHTRDKDRINERSRQYSHTKRENGLCKICSRPAGDKVYCIECSNRANKLTKLRYHNSVKDGCCIYCQAPAVDGRVHCEACLSKNRSRAAKVRAERIEKGLCFDCGKWHVATGAKRCRNCHYKMISVNLYRTSKRWRELARILENQNSTCPYTGRALQPELNAELDHILPRSKGGSDEINNLQWVLADVNRMKRHHLQSDFLALVENIYEYRLKGQGAKLNSA